MVLTIVEFWMEQGRLARRDFLRVAGLGAAALITGCGSTVPVLSKRLRGSRPNIIFIMADDLGYGDLGCYGQKYIRTSCIDRMAAEGIRFTQCYAGSCVCAPSRSVLMTGQHTGHTRIRENKCASGGVRDEVTGGGCRAFLLEEDVTVAEVLKEAGYATAITGKWGLGDPDTPGIPTRQGFDQWLGYLNQNHAVYYYTDYLWRNEQKLMLEENRDGKRSLYTHDLFTEFALDFIRRHKDKPFFLYVAYTIPHFNLEVPDTEPYTDKPWPEKAKIFAAMITRMDKDVGRILSLLEQLGIDENTIVFFTSDNGGAGGGGAMFNSNGPLRGGKGGFKEGGIRVPMVVRWPGKIPAGKVSDACWYFADVLPTLAELAAVAAPKNIDGISVLSALLGGKQPELNNRFMYWESPPPHLRQVVRWRNFKALRRKPDGLLKLYDLAKDPMETEDVGHRHPEAAAVIERYLETARTPSAYWPDRQ